MLNHVERLKGVYYDVISMCVKLLIQHLFDKFHLGSKVALQGKRWCENQR